MNGSIERLVEAKRFAYVARLLTEMLLESPGAVADVAAGGRIGAAAFGHDVDPRGSRGADRPSALQTRSRKTMLP